MNRRLLLGAILIATLTLGTNTTNAAAASCANSFPSDGHLGPWWTSGSGGTVHGNTVHVDCPGPDVHWDLNYKIQIVNSGSVVSTILNQHRSGNGSPAGDFSFSLNPYNCDSIFAYRTHVDNNVTGGNINKPSGGSGVHIANSC